MKIIVLGYMGSGKSTISKILAEKMHLDFYDLDQIIEKSQEASIASIFKKNGEIYFRKIESILFKSFVSKTKDFVLALGGGTPCYANNHEVLKEEGVISFYLKGSIATLVSRLENETNDRPLISDLDTTQLEDYIRMHLFDRSYYYLQAKHVINIDDKSVEEIISEMEKKLR